MYKHIVVWTFQENAGGRTREENIREAKERLRALPALVPAIRRLQVGGDLGWSEGHHDLALIVETESREDLEAYVRDPHHQAVSKFIRSVCATRTVADIGDE